jgi:prepilin-type N-terminal cleavage/methylation domain-containing protein
LPKAMKNLYKNKREQGFTIIEVLIVLAIAALILLIVFLAVPSLQRNARNTQRKSDAANIAAAIGNFAGNNNGALPTADGYVSTDVANWLFYCNGAGPGLAGGVTVTAGRNVTYAGAGCQTTNKNFESAKAGYYKPGDNNVWFNNVTGASITTAAPAGSETLTSPSINSIIVDLGYSCNSDANGVNTSPNARAYSVVYVQESSSGNGNLQCVGS